MLSPITLPKKKNAEAAFDDQQLYAIGLEHVQRLTGLIWTDYNIHDPGVTTLELLCYAITELSYRASFPVEDLLASEEGNAENMRGQFFSARQILPNRPLTISDYRKLLIDLKLDVNHTGEISVVKNAWLRAAPLSYYTNPFDGQDSDLLGFTEVKISGLYDVIIEYRDEITSEHAKEKVMDGVKRLLSANRNLCEDFVSFAAVETQGFILCAELELTPVADEAKVQAEIFFKVQQYLAPPVNRYTLSEMREWKQADGSPRYTADKIFEGPSLQGGFIDDEELADANLREEIRLSDIINIIMDIQEVQAVRDILISPQDTQGPPENIWLVPVSPGKKAWIDQDGPSRLVFYKRNMRVEPNNDKVNNYYEILTKSVKTETENSYDFAIPLGKYRQPASYYSFQNHYPTVYGISEVGLGSAVDDRRKALAYQLKAYLLFFDQVMANYLAQLNHVRDLFSTDPTLKNTYFQQVVNTFTDYEKIYKITDIESSIPEDQSVFIERRNRFLDHLIARFAERCHDYVYTMYSTFGSTPEQLFDYKCRFLNAYPVISSERSLAYDYSLKKGIDLWNTENVSGLEKRLARLLGIQNDKRRNLSDIAHDIYAELDETPGDEFRFRIRKKDTGKIILSSSTHYATPELATKEMRRAIRFALMPISYQRKDAINGTHYFNIIDDAGEVIARRLEYFDNESQMDAAIDELMNYLRVNYSDEGMYLIENILLRPEQGGDPLLPVCIDSSCNNCAEADPYSYRIHIILPAYGQRFSNMDFRRFAEEVIREETPAHILPKICWISQEDMAVLEKQYHDWIELKAGLDTTAGRTVTINNFIDTLFRVKNVYPSNLLLGEFILGQTAIS
jgi:hypothetical protein